MKKTSLMIFFVMSIVFSTIYSPQAMLPTLQKVFSISVAKTNLLLSVVLLVLMLVTPFYKHISNRGSKKKLMSLSILLLSLSFLISASSSSFNMLLFSRVLQGIFLPGIAVTMFLYVQEIYPDDKQGMGGGIYMAATGLGAVLGRLIAGWATYLYSWETAFTIFSILLLVAFLGIIGLPNEKISITNSKILKSKIKTLSYLKDLKVFFTLLISSTVFFIFMAVTAFITYYLADSLFNLNVSEISNVFLVLLFGVFASPIAGKLSDKIGRRKVLFIGVFILIIGILLTFIQLYFAVLLGLGLVTVGMFSVQAVAPIYINELIPNNKEAASILYQSFFYLGGSLGAFVPAIVWGYGGYIAIALLCLVIITVAMLPFVYITLSVKN